jgi:hypothetical protein
MKKEIKLILLFIIVSIQFVNAQSSRGGMFTDEQWKEYDMVKRWIDSSQNVIIDKNTQLQLDLYCLKNPQNKPIVNRLNIFVKAIFNEKFTVIERIAAADYILDMFKDHPEDVRYPIYVINALKLKLKNSNPDK